MSIFIIALFAVTGAILFRLCALVRALRRFAMPVALSVLGFGCALVGNLLVLSLALFRMEHLPWHGTAAISDKFGNWIFFLTSFVAVFETVILIALHGWVVRRMTRALFRLYAGFVGAGVGSILGCTIALFASSYMPRGYHWLPFAGLLIAPVELGWFCWKHAEEFRGPRPEFMQPVLKEEY